MTKEPSRRTFLSSVGAATAFGALGATLGAQAASATPTLEDLGPAVLGFGSFTAKLVGDNFYVGSRAVSPTTVVEFHVPTQQVTRVCQMASRLHVRALAAHNNILYAGIAKGGPPFHAEPNLYRWDLTVNDAVPLATITDLNEVRAVAVAPDGTVYASGEPAGVCEIDAGTGDPLPIIIPDPNAGQAFGLAASDDHIFLGTGTVRGGTTTSSYADLFAIDRQTGVATSILPSAVAGDKAIEDVAVIDGRIYAGSQGISSSDGHLTVLSLADFSVVAIHSGLSSKPEGFIGVGNDVYFAVAGGLHRYAPATDQISAVSGAEVFGRTLGHLNGVILGEHDPSGGVRTYDLATAAIGFTDLVSAGAPELPLAPMSLATTSFPVQERIVCVGSHNAFARHALSWPNSPVETFRVPGEPKTIEIVGSTTYYGAYNRQGIWKYETFGSTPPQQEIALPYDQNRPRTIAWDETNDLLLVGVQADTVGGGSLNVYDPASSSVATYVNPFQPEVDAPFAVAAADGLAYLGGGKAKVGNLACWDPQAGTKLWQIKLSPAYPVRNIFGLAVADGILFGMTNQGVLFVVDVADQSVLHVSSLGSDYKQAALALFDGEIYGASAQHLFKVDPITYAVTVLATDLNADLASSPHLAISAEGYIYTFQGRNLVRYSL